MDLNKDNKSKLLDENIILLEEPTSRNADGVIIIYLYKKNNFDVTENLGFIGSFDKHNEHKPLSKKDCRMALKVLKDYINKFEKGK